MALFSRRPKVSADQPAAVEPEAGTEAEVEVAVGEADQEAAEQAAVAASIDISVSSFRGLGAHVESPPRADAPAAPAVPTPHASARAEAPPRTETVPGVRDNVLVREALAGLSESPAPPELMNVARQLMQGHLFLRVKGDARALLAEGKGLPLAVGTVGDRSFALAYSGGAALQDSVRLDGDVDTSAMGQPVLVVLRHVLAGPSDGLIIDHASAPARAVLPRALLEKLLERLDESLTVKTLLAEERTPATPAAVAEALTHVPFWVAVGRGPDDRPGVAEGRAEDGSRFLEVFSHPLEVVAMGRRDQPAPLTSVQLASALSRDEGLSGVVVDPGGPWIRLSRDDLAPLIALAG